MQFLFIWGEGLLGFEHEFCCFLHYFSEYFLIRVVSFGDVTGVLVSNLVIDEGGDEGFALQRIPHLLPLLLHHRNPPQQRRVRPLLDAGMVSLQIHSFVLIHSQLSNLLFTLLLLINNLEQTTLKPL